MASSREFADYVTERLSPLGDVTARRMFGGFGVFLDGLMFALIADDTLYLKVDEGNRERYLAAGLEPFRPVADRPKTMSYFPLPEEVFEDEEALAEWAGGAFAAALRGRRQSGSKPADR